MEPIWEPGFHQECFFLVPYTDAAQAPGGKWVGPEQAGRGLVGLHVGDSEAGEDIQLFGGLEGSEVKVGENELSLSTHLVPEGRCERSGSLEGVEGGGGGLTSRCLSAGRRRRLQRRGRKR